MRNIESRISKLEQSARIGATMPKIFSVVFVDDPRDARPPKEQSGPGKNVNLWGWDGWHILRKPGQSDDDAMSAAGLIPGPRDVVIVWGNA